MNFYFKNTVGIFWGANAFALTLVKSAFYDVKLDKCEVHDFEPNASKEKQKEALVREVQNFFQKNRISSADLAMGVSRRITILREIEFPAAVKENLRTTLEFELEKYIPLSAEEVCFDYQIISRDKKRKTFKVLVVIVKKEDIEPLFDLMTEVKAESAAIDISTTGLLYAVSGSSKTQSPEGAVIACPGMDGLEIFSRNRDFFHGSRFFPDIPSETGGTKEPRPEGTEEPRPEIETKDEAVSAIENYLTAGSSGEAPFVFACGPLARNKAVYSLEERVAARIEPVHFAEAAGLALKQADSAFTGINLIPEDKRIKNGRKVYYYFGFILLGVLLAGMAWGGSVVLKNYIQYNIYESRLTELSHEVAALEKTVQQKELVDKKIDRIIGFSSGGTAVTDILRELTLTVPKSAWISEFEYAEKGLEISGYADSASGILTALEKSAMFKDASFVSSIRKRYGKEMFKIGFQIDN